jgi:hypothetical protein
MSEHTGGGIVVELDGVDRTLEVAGWSSPDWGETHWGIRGFR